PVKLTSRELAAKRARRSCQPLTSASRAEFGYKSRTKNCYTRNRMWHPEPTVRHSIPEARWPTADEAARALLFRPVRVGALTLESRTWVPAMVPWRATADGFVTRENLEWYGRFAAGRPGAIVVEATGIRDIPSGPLLRIGHDRFIPGLKELVETVHRESEGRTRLLIQIRSEEHTSELQSPCNLVCRLLLEKKKQ